MKNNNYFPVLALLLVVILASGCQFSNLYEQTTDFNGNSWNANNHLSYPVAVTDTANGYDIYILLRNTGAYPYSNIYFFVRTQAPGGTTLTDTLEFQLAAPDGKWYGKGWGSTWSHRLGYKHNIRFPMPGIYTFDIIHGMRDNELRGLPDAGLLITRSQN